MFGVLTVDEVHLFSCNQLFQKYFQLLCKDICLLLSRHALVLNLEALVNCQVFSLLGVLKICLLNEASLDLQGLLDISKLFSVKTCLFKVLESEGSEFVIHFLLNFGLC